VVTEPSFDTPVVMPPGMLSGLPGQALKHACLKPMQAASAPIRAMLVGVFVRRRCSVRISAKVIVPVISNLSLIIGC